MRSSAKRLWSDQSGAIAAVYALALPALIAVGGIAFDYTRLAAMDTELQNAADQAALAAATQLNGQDGAVERATNAASALVENNTVFSNDAGGRGVSIAIVKFYEDREGENEVDPADADADALAQYVEVTVGAREALYALTPIVGAFRSGEIDASAMAGVSSSICNVPPLFMAFKGAADLDRLTKGTGVLLLNAGLNADEDASPAQFGYLEVGIEKDKGARDLIEAMAWDTQVGECQPTAGVKIQPGRIAAVEKGFNIRFASDPKNCPGKDVPCSRALSTMTFLRDTCHENDELDPLPPCSKAVGDGNWPGKDLKTRYELYQDDILNQGKVFDFGTDRRRLTVAVISSADLESAGPNDPLTPEKWLDVFITEPMDGNGAAKRFYVEVIGDSSPTTSGRRDVPYIIR